MAPSTVQHMPSGNGTGTLDTLPLELRLKIYKLIFDDLISELSDNLFGVFSLHDVLYNYTGQNLDSHVGKTGLTTLLSTCKKMHAEALETLCAEAEFVVNITGADDGQDNERERARFSADSQLLAFAKNLKVNLEPVSDATNDRFVRRVRHFTQLINQGVELRSLKIRLCGIRLEDPKSIDNILAAMSLLQTRGRCVEVYLGEVSEEILSEERLDHFIRTIGGVYKGRNHRALEPDHWDEGSEDEAYCTMFS